MSGSLPSAAGRRNLRAPTDDAPRLGGDASLVDLLDRVLERGVTITGDVVLSVAGVDLVHLGIRLVLTGVDERSEAL